MKSFEERALACLNMFMGRGKGTTGRGWEIEKEEILEVEPSLEKVRG